MEDNNTMVNLPGSSVQSRRQVEKSKAKMMKETYFLVNWMNDPDGDDMYDVVSSKMVVPPDEINILEVTPGTVCKVAFDGSYYKAKVLEVGTCTQLKKSQKQLEKRESEKLTNEDDIQNADDTCAKLVQHTSEPCNMSDNEHDASITVKQTAERKGKITKSSSANVPGDECTFAKQPDREYKKTYSKPKQSPKKIRPSCSPRKVNPKRARPGAIKKPSASISSKSRPINLTLSSSSEEDILSDGDSYTETPKGRASTKKGSASARVLLASKALRAKEKTDKGASEPKRPRSMRDDSDSDEVDFSDNESVPSSRIRRKSKQSAEEAKRDWQRQFVDSTFKEPPPKQQMGGSDLGGYGLPPFQLQFIQDRVAKLEETTKKLSSKVKAQALEITELRRRSVTPSSETSDTSTTPKQQQPSTSQTVRKEVPIPGDEVNILVCGHPVDRLKLQAAKLQMTPSKCALKLLQCIFTFEELALGNPSGTTTSKGDSRKRTIQKLDPTRMAYIYDYVEGRWPNSYVEQKILKKLTQRCTDLHGDYERARM